jgi:hypothetical protein
MGIEGIGPCVVILHKDRGGFNTYGPFESTDKAEAWMSHQLRVGLVRSFSVEPLRFPYIERTNNDWWAGDWHQSTIVDREFPTTSWFKTNRKVWRRWLKSTRRG